MSGTASRFPALKGLRIGCVQYLNSRPLIHAFDGPVTFDHPSGLARELSGGRIDAALVPIFEVLRDPHYVLVDDVAIACDGPVFSVFLAHRGPLADVRTIALDPASLTSVHLLQVLLAEFHGLHPHCVDARKLSGDVDAQLLIGNQAIEFRARDAGRHTLLDLGAEWQQCTGLPFVFAAWALGRDLPGLPEVAQEFRTLKREGWARLEEIVATEKACPAELARSYLTQYIRFDLREREKAAIERFGGLLVRHGFISAPPNALRYV